eukprot:TRINITY_DN5459_c0_g1_i4.p1 TRINITY_DN5459_c0_g1~~TRINITY_DN5459_c0_g1_i4.p1  ORF type:complete len:336 (+),score=113.41 TRINITY_DN5459_c0_g1_i4:95-1009(+)
MALNHPVLTAKRNKKGGMGLDIFGLFSGFKSEEYEVHSNPLYSQSFGGMNPLFSGETGSSMANSVMFDKPSFAGDFMDVDKFNLSVNEMSMEIPPSEAPQEAPNVTPQEAPQSQPQGQVKPETLLQSKELKEPQNKQLKEIQVDFQESQEIDVTKLPKILDSKYEKIDSDNALRPTIINVSDTWTKVSFKSLLSPPQTKALGVEEQKNERNLAYDLIDALSNSGGVPFSTAELHVVIAATHAFDKSIINTVVQDNMNPIEKVEKSLLVIGSTILDKGIEELVKPEQFPRVIQFSPELSTLRNQG